LRAKDTPVDATAVPDRDHCAPQSVQLYDAQRTAPIENFTELLAREPPLATSSVGARAYEMADYCMHAQRIMARILITLDDHGVCAGAPAVGTDAPPMEASERSALSRLRAKWHEHLRAHAQSLWSAPPGAGGSVARYSLAVQLWLLVAHANCILQAGDACNNLFDFDASESIYLSRNWLPIECAPVMQYPLRTLVAALGHFAHSLDTLDRYESDYMRYAHALEHRLSQLLCRVGGADEYNAREWCVPHVDERNKKKARADGDADDDGNDLGAVQRERVRGSALGAARDGDERVSDEFLMYTMVWLMTVYNYAEAYCDVSYTSYALAGRVRRVAVRVPAHRVADAPWVPSTRTTKRISAFLCQYTHSLVDDTYRHALRSFLLQFELRPPDTELYRLLNNSRAVHIRSVLQYEFRGASSIARAYLRRVHYERAPWEYMCELLQWQQGDAQAARSASLARQNMTRQCAVLWAIHQYCSGTYKLNWKQTFLLFHRDPAFVTTMQRARTFRHPIIVQQFARFTVLVPHRRAPRHDIAQLLHVRRCVRAARAGVPQPPTPDALVNAPPDDAAHARHLRAYDCSNAIDAFAVWATWFLQLCDGRVDDSVSLRSLLVELLGYNVKASA